MNLLRGPAFWVILILAATVAIIGHSEWVFRRQIDELAATRRFLTDSAQDRVFLEREMKRLREGLRERIGYYSGLENLEEDRTEVREVMKALREAENRRIVEGFESVLLEVEVYQFAEDEVERLASQFDGKAEEFREECERLVGQGKARRVRHRVRIPIRPVSDAPIQVSWEPSLRDFDPPAVQPPLPTRISSSSERRVPLYLLKVDNSDELPGKLNDHFPGDFLADRTGFSLSAELKRGANGELKGQFGVDLSDGVGWDRPRTSARISSEVVIDGEGSFLLGTSRFATSKPDFYEANGQVSSDSEGDGIAVFARCRF